MHIMCKTEKRLLASIGHGFHLKCFLLSHILNTCFPACGAMYKTIECRVGVFLVERVTNSGPWKISPYYFFVTIKHHDQGNLYKKEFIWFLPEDKSLLLQVYWIVLHNIDSEVI